MSKEDSRLKGYQVRITHPTLPLVRTFCVNCGRPKGWVSDESYEFIKAQQIIVICDQCEAEVGAPPELEVAPIREY
jgi:hypothetical protein